MIKIHFNKVEVLEQKEIVGGAVAQLGERQNRTLEVASSTLVCSIYMAFN